MVEKKSNSFIIFTAVVCVVAAAVYYFVFTAKGSGFIARTALANYLGPESVNIEKTEGSLSQGLVFQNIEFNGLKQLPPGNNLKIQKLEVDLNFFGRGGFSVKIHNGRLHLPGSDRVIFYGDYQNGTLNLTVYSNAVGVRETLDLFAKSSELKDLAGILRNIDISIKGSFLAPQISGEFQIEQLSQKSFAMTNSSGALSLQLKDIKTDLKIQGEILLNDGKVFGPKTAVINLQKSKIIFSGEPRKPSFDLRGVSRVGDVKINIELKGTVGQPSLKLTSQPSLPQGQLLVMLATNKSWQDTENALKKGELSADLAKDFLDYFVFSGTGNKIAEKFGLDTIAVKYDREAKGVGITKSVSGKTAASYSVEQSQGKMQEPATTHKVGAEYKITENISAAAEKELKPDNNADQEQEGEKADDKVILKFKKEF